MSWVNVTYRTAHDRDGEDSNEPYSQRACTRFAGFDKAYLVDDHFQADYCSAEVPDEWNDGRQLYAVCVGYQTGDTFGYDGRAGVLSVWDAIWDAEAFAGHYADLDHNDFSFEYNGETYSDPAAGYFEFLSSVQVVPVTYKSKEFL